MEMNKENNTPFKAEDVNWDKVAGDPGWKGKLLSCAGMLWNSCIGSGEWYCSQRNEYPLFFILSI